MMKFADIGPLIWVIVIVMVSLAKGWSKLQQSAGNESSKSDDSLPVAPPKPPPRLQPRPAVAPMPRANLPPQQRAVPPRAMPRPGVKTMSGERKVSADDIRQFVEKLGGKPQVRPPPPPPSPPPIQAPARRRSVRKAAAPPPPPRQEPAPAAPVASQTVTASPTPAQVSRASQWMEALRDRNNVRNIIIGAEVIGPPKAESM